MKNKILQNRGIIVSILVIVIMGMYALSCRATDLPSSNPQTEQHHSLWSTISAGNEVGYLILLMSMVSVSFIIRNFITIRRDRLLPDDLITELEETMSQKEYEQARQHCSENNSYLARVVDAGLSQLGSMFGFFDIQNAMQETSEREVSKLYRKLEYLSFIASTAPMMGLLGTVLGMIKAFNQISLLQGADRPSELAGGISEALVTTCLGLIVAIPTMFFVAFFRNRIESMINEAEAVAEKLMGRFRQETLK